jgi:nitrate reductase NapE component
MCSKIYTCFLQKPQETSRVCEIGQKDGHKRKQDPKVGLNLLLFFVVVVNLWSLKPILSIGVVVGFSNSQQY